MGIPSELVNNSYDWSVPLASPHRFDLPTLVDLQSDTPLNDFNVDYKPFDI